MKHHFDKRHVYGALLNMALVFGIMQPLQALPATIALATSPLTNATTTSVLPNLMFVLDSSGSMDWNYLPDWVDDSICKNTDGDYDLGCVNSPLFQSPDVNGVYYNPEIRYLPPVKSDGTSYPSQTSWTGVKNDAYSVQDRTGTTNLVDNYVDVEWCTNETDNRGRYTYATCLRNDNYILPGTVQGKTYDVMHTTVASGQKNLATGSTTSPTVISNRAVGPHYYRITPGEYCDSPKLVNCQPVQDAVYTYAAPVRWCTDATNASKKIPDANSCQGLRTGSYKTIRFPTRYPSTATAATQAVPAAATFSFDESDNCSSNKKSGIGSILVNGINILSSATANVSTATQLANAIRGKAANGGYSFGGSGNKLTITAPVGAGNITAGVTWTYASGSNSNCTFKPTTAQFGGYQPAKPALPEGAGSFVRTDIVDGATYPKALGRTDCAGSTCTYSEEMTNFANWWTYYQTRMQTMKTATSLAFKPIDNRYRVGFIDIYGGNYLPVATFSGGALGGGSVKDSWYTKLFSMAPDGGTPLRSALARVGQIYAGQKPVGSADPVQYSCQQNFTLLTTDGYWNGDTSRNATVGVNGLTGSLVGNMDGKGVAPPMYEGPTASSNSLADVAKYYYDTDLRTSALGNCTGAMGTGIDVCENNVFQSDTDKNAKQHMTTFTLGLGVNGALLYQSNYKTATSGDFHNITDGSGNWPVPVADTETAVDDLWHAAVNGQGTYFSAKDPTQLSSGLKSALTAIGAKLGAGSAAATSSLNPVAGDNFSYVASYTTVKWQGNLEERTIDLSNGNVSQAAQWCVEDTVTASCAGSITSSTSGNTTTYFCSIPNSTAAACTDGTFDGTSSTCNVPVQRSCQGTMRNRINANSDTRLIKMSNGSGALVDFTYANLSTTQIDYFNGQQLSQWADLDADQKTLAAGENLVKYLRGQNGFEDQSNNSVLNRLYRYREATLGDIIESQPQYDGPAKFKYTDTKYSDYIVAKASGPRTIYVGANDGMLHAFNAEDGVERWAYVPTPVIPNLSTLADKNYATAHKNYVNGSPVIADVYDSVAAKWRTILVSGLNGGGRGYFALDVTTPDQPSLLWEINSTTESNLGYSFGHPIVVKNSTGRWVVLLTSGYNNVNPGDGGGYLFVRDALTGARISTIGTGVGGEETPSGLAKISSYGNDPVHDATSVATYGGDLLGNVWRFDIDAGTAVKMATLKDSSGAAQPVTSIPELGAAYGKRIVFVGTGKYLENIDLSTTQRQTFYAITDDGTSTTLTDPRSVLKQQVFTLSDDGVTRTASQNPVDLRTDRGWYVDFPDNGERVNIDPKLDAGLLIVATTVPSNTVCAPGGYSWLNYFNYLTGTIDNGITSVKTTAPIVGINIFYTPDGQRRINIVTANDPTPKVPPGAPPPPSNLFNFQGKRVIWRELIP